MLKVFLVLLRRLVAQCQPGAGAVLRRSQPIGHHAEGVCGLAQTTVGVDACSSVLSDSATQVDEYLLRQHVCSHYFWLVVRHVCRAVCLFVGCLSSQQLASVSQGRICTDNFTCCHTEIEATDQTFHLTQSQYTDTGPTSPSADPITPGAWQGSHWSANC